MKSTAFTFAAWALVMLSLATFFLAADAFMAAAHFGSDGKLACRFAEAGSKLQAQCASFEHHVEHLSNTHTRAVMLLFLGAVTVLAAAFVTFYARNRARNAAQQTRQADGPASGGSAA